MLVQVWTVFLLTCLASGIVLLGCSPVRSSHMPAMSAAGAQAAGKVPTKAAVVAA
jgi:hypothetical protein